MKTRYLIKGAVLLIMAFAGTARAEEVSVKFMDIQGIGNMLVRVAASKGYCTKYGIKCELQVFPSAPLGMQAMLAKSIDVALSPPEVVINAAIKGVAVKAIANGLQLSLEEIVVRNGLAVPDGNKDYKAMMLALKGKKIGVPARGSAGEIKFGILAESAGLKLTDFTYVAVGGPVTSFGALKSSQIDASLSYEPAASLCDVTKVCRTAYRASDAPEPQPIATTNGAGAVLVVTQEMIDRSPKSVDAVISAMKDAEAFLQNPANFAEALQITSSYFKFSLPDGDKLLETSLRLSVSTFKAGISRDALKQIAANMLATNQIAAPFDTSTIVYGKAPDSGKIQ